MKRSLLVRGWRHHYDAAGSLTNQQLSFRRRRRTRRIHHQVVQSSITTTTHASPQRQQQQQQQHHHHGGRIGRLILVRHGQSEWNVTDPSRGLTTRFTGWADIGLTQQGRHQAAVAGQSLATWWWKQQQQQQQDVDSGDHHPHGLLLEPPFHVAVCSLLRRTQDTLTLLLDAFREEMQQKDQKQQQDAGLAAQYMQPPLIQSWRLNERHYGALVGLGKAQAEQQFGKHRTDAWRHGWDVRPPAMPEDLRREWGITGAHCKAHTWLASAGRRVRIEEKAHSATAFMPASESLQDTCQRVLPLWVQGLVPRLARGETILLVAHSNTVKAMLYFLDPTVVTPDSFGRIKIPSAVPLLYQFVAPSSSSSSSSSLQGGPTDAAHHVVPGGLQVVTVPPRTKHHNSHHHHHDENLRYALHGTWIETKEISQAQFCTPLGQEHLEHEIA